MVMHHRESPEEGEAWATDRRKTEVRQREGGLESCAGSRAGEAVMYGERSGDRRGCVWGGV